MNTSPNVEGNIKQAMEDWYNEIQQYNYAGKSCAPMSCHYTQVIGVFFNFYHSLGKFSRRQTNAIFLFFFPENNSHLAPMICHSKVNVFSTFTTLWTNSADYQLVLFFLFFPRK